MVSTAGNYGKCFYGRAGGTGARANVLTRVKSEKAERGRRRQAAKTVFWDSPPEKPDRKSEYR